MKAFLHTCAVLLGLCGFILAGGCTSRRPPAATTLPAEPIGQQKPDSAAYPARYASSAAVPDSVVVQPHLSLLDKVLGWQPALIRTNNGASGKSTELPARIGKKSTVQIFYAPAILNTAGKKATILGAGAVLAAKNATAIAADSGAKVQVATVRRGQAAAGEGISQVQPVPASLLDRVVAGLTGPLGILLAAGVVGGLVWLLLWFRRKKNELA